MQYARDPTAEAASATIRRRMRRSGQCVRRDSEMLAVVMREAVSARTRRRIRRCMKRTAVEFALLAAKPPAGSCLAGKPQAVAFLQRW